MKLAEALMQRADTNKRIQELRGRLQRSAVVQEGETPPEDVGVLLNELSGAAQQQVDLISRINHTNAVTEVEPGVTITTALSARDVFTAQRDVLTFLIAHTANAMTQHRARATELRAVSMVNVADIQKRVDTLSANLRRLDALVQERNWTADLIE